MSIKFYPRNDLVFKRIFGDKRSGNVLRDFLKAALNLSDDDLSKIELLDAQTKIEKSEKKEHDAKDSISKLGTLDIKCTTKTGKIIVIELQVKEDLDMRNRSFFYLSRAISEQLKRRDKYSSIKKVILIIISVEHIIIQENDDYKFRFVQYDPEHNLQLSDLIEIHILEAKKLPNQIDDKLSDWLKFIKSQEMEEMEILANKNPAIQEALLTYKSLTEDEAFREEQFRQEMLEHDIATRIGHAEDRAKIEIAKNFLKMGLSAEQIAKGTDLSIEEIESLRII